MLVAAVIVGALALYFIFDRDRFHGSGKGVPGVRPTQEVFHDSVSGQRMRVYENPNSGEREYRQSDDDSDPL